MKRARGLGLMLPSGSGMFQFQTSILLFPKSCQFCRSTRGDHALQSLLRKCGQGLLRAWI
jgi:hypothetical protein